MEFAFYRRFHLAHHVISNVLVVGDDSSPTTLLIHLNFDRVLLVGERELSDNSGGSLSPRLTIDNAAGLYRRDVLTWHALSHRCASIVAHFRKLINYFQLTLKND